MFGHFHPWFMLTIMVLEALSPRLMEEKLIFVVEVMLLTPASPFFAGLSGQISQKYCIYYYWKGSVLSY